MDKIKTSELISKLALASEEACKCEDINFEFAFHGAIKKDSAGTADWWWLRCASSNDNYGFYAVSYTGAWSDTGAGSTCGVSPAFRIG